MLNGRKLRDMGEVESKRKSSLPDEKMAELITKYRNNNLSVAEDNELGNFIKGVTMQAILRKSKTKTLSLSADEIEDILGYVTLKVFSKSIPRINVDDKPTAYIVAAIYWGVAEWFHRLENAINKNSKEISLAEKFQAYREMELSIPDNICKDSNIDDVLNYISQIETVSDHKVNTTFDIDNMG